MMVEALVYFFVPALVGVLIGIASGLLGIGGGTVMVPIFRLAFGMSATMSTATSLFCHHPDVHFGRDFAREGQDLHSRARHRRGPRRCVSVACGGVARAAFPRLAR